MNKKLVENKPWYKEFWVWVIIGMPAIVIVGCIFTVVIAFTNADTVVDENWNNNVEVISQHLKRERMAERLGLRASIAVSRYSGLVVIKIKRKSLDEPKSKTLLLVKSKQMRLTLEHPTLPQYDQSITLYQTGENEYKGQLEKYYSGWRYLSLSPQNGEWTIKGKIKLFTHHKQTIG